MLKPIQKPLCGLEVLVCMGMVEQSESVLLLYHVFVWNNKNLWVPQLYHMFTNH